MNTTTTYEPTEVRRRVMRVRVTLVMDVDTAEYAAEYGTDETRREVREYVEPSAADAVRDAFRLTLPSASQSVRVAE